MLGRKYRTDPGKWVGACDFFLHGRFIFLYYYSQLVDPLKSFDTARRRQATLFWSNSYDSNATRICMPKDVVRNQSDDEIVDENNSSLSKLDSESDIDWRLWRRLFSSGYGRFYAQPRRPMIASRNSNPQCSLVCHEFFNEQHNQGNVPLGVYENICGYPWDIIG
jgi:hypothetical protein